MRATKSLALLVLALGCGLVASLGISQVMARRGEVPVAETQSVLVVAHDITQGEVLNADAIKVEEWPKGKVPVGALVRAEDGEGRRARAKFYAGEPVLEQKLFGKGESAGYDTLIPKGYRVVSVRVDAVTIHGGLVMPGSRVDIQVHMSRNPAIGIPDTTTRTILQDIKVFAVNDVVNLDNQGQETKSIQARTVSLLVTPMQAEKITLAGELGTIRLVMRSPDDDQQANTRGATAPELFGNVDPSKRDKESLLLPAPAVAAATKESSSNTGFVDFLNTVRTQMAKKGNQASPTPAKDPSRWAMRVLKGADVHEVDLEGDDPQAAADPDFKLWKINGLKGSEPIRPADVVAAKDELRLPKDKKDKDEAKPAKESTGEPKKDATKPSDKSPADSRNAAASAATPRTN